MPIIFSHIAGWSRGLYVQTVYTAAAIACAAASFIALTGLRPLEPIPPVVEGLVIINMIILAGLAWIVIARYLKIRHSGTGAGGGRLTRRFMLLFAAVAMLPTIIVSVFLWMMITKGIDTWLGERVLTLVEEIKMLTEEHGKKIVDDFERDATLMAGDVNDAAEGYNSDRALFESYLGKQAFVRNMDTVYIIDQNGTPESIGRNTLTEGRAIIFNRFYARPSPEMLAEAQNGEIVTILNRDANHASALLKLSGLTGKYLYLAKPIDPALFVRLDRVRQAQRDYRLAERASQRMQTLFVIVYLQIATLALLLSLWWAQTIARRISGPITRLAVAANQVSQGQQAVSVPLPDNDDEVLALSKSFNAMTCQLDERRAELLSAREDADKRRNFLETLLGRLSAGVIRLDTDGQITLANASAETLLDKKSIIGLSMSDISPEIARQVSNANKMSQPVDVALNLKTLNGLRHVRLKITRDPAGGYVLTLDDATRLITAQRHLAWRDVARRIAHEIRNPLTPIQLSTERIRKRYAGLIDDEDGVFERCTETIMRQVSDIERMVREFSNFARMPKPFPTPFNLTALLEDIIFGQHIINPDYTFTLNAPETSLYVTGDERLLAQAITNLLKNATEALSSRPETDEIEGRVILALSRDDDRDCVTLTITDNGPGLPNAIADDILEPYVTGREGGTGLGLAIVNRIITDHGGTIHLSTRPDGQSGTLAHVTLPERMATADMKDFLPMEHLI